MLLKPAVTFGGVSEHFKDRAVTACVSRCFVAFQCSRRLTGDQLVIKMLAYACCNINTSMVYL